MLITNVETTARASLDLEWTDTIYQHLVDLSGVSRYNRA
jgi:hypothetical protein